MERQFSRFLRVVTLTVFGGFVLSTMLVIVVDPYGLYRVVSAAGFNEVKPRPNRYQEEIKLVGAQFVHANALILGNSRADIGFDPQHPAMLAKGLSAYNLAIPGTSIQTSVRQIEYLVSKKQPPKYLLVGLEFLDFPVDPEMKGDFTRENIASSPLEKWSWRIDTLFSLASVMDALTTIKIQRDTYAEVMTDRGLNPLLEYDLLARQEGYYSLFRQRAEENAKAYLSKPHGLFYAGAEPSRQILALRDMLRLAAEHRTDVDLVIYPYHAQILLIIEKTGLWPLFSDWKKLLVSEVAAARKQYPGLNVNLWDFSGYSGPRCEVIPKKGDKVSKTRWYWEAGHFKSELGGLVIARVLDQWSSSGNDADEGFGIKLDSNALLMEPARLLVEREVCRRFYPALFDEVDQMMQKMD